MKDVGPQPGPSCYFPTKQGDFNTPRTPKSGYCVIHRFKGYFQRQLVFNFVSCQFCP